MFRQALRPYLASAVLAIVLAVASLAILNGLYRDGLAQQKLIVAYFRDAAGLREALIVWWLFSAPIIGGLLLRHRFPLVALVLVTIGVARHQLDPRFGVQPLDFAVPIVLYTVASLAKARWMSAAALAGVLTGEYLISLVGRISSERGLLVDAKPSSAPAEPLTTTLLNAAGGSFQVILILVLAFAVGDAVRSRRHHLRLAEQRAADLEHEQHQRAVLARAAERARISRELHDVVAHSLSVIVIQAQGAAATLNYQPACTAPALQALQQVVSTGRGALTEMRRLLGLIRHDTGGADAQLTPEPGTGALSDLVDQMCAAGLRVRLRVEGEPAQLPASVDLSAYRIVQEALTNTLKHAGEGTDATVRLAFTTDTLDVEVTDNGPGSTAAPSGDGHGLRGIAERVDLLGGELMIGPADPAGFRVRALLPIGADT